MMNKRSYLYFKVSFNNRNRVFLYSYIFFLFFLLSVIVYDAYKTHQNEIKQFQVSSTNLSLALEFELSSSFNNINLILIHLQKDFEIYNEINKKHTNEINNI